MECFMRNAERLLGKIFEGHPKDFNIGLWDGSLIKWSDSPKFTLIFNDKEAFKKVMIASDAYKAGKAFIEGKVDITGDVFEAIKLADHLSQLRFSFIEKMGLLLEVMRL